MAVKLTR